MGILAGLGIVFLSCSPALKNTAPVDRLQEAVNPDEFGNWEVINLLAESPVSAWGIFGNPDKSSPIRIVAVNYNMVDGSIKQYRYFKRGEPYAFEYCEKLKGYKQMKISEAQRKACFDCHSNKTQSEKI
jgi:hypothetical protein